MGSCGRVGQNINFSVDTPVGKPPKLTAKTPSPPSPPSQRATGHFSAWFCSGCFSCSCTVRHGFEVALFACFGVSIDVFPGFSYSYSAPAVLVLVLVLVLEDTPSSTSTSTISLSTSTIKAKTAQLQNAKAD